MDDLLPEFVAETRDTLQSVTGTLVAWEADPDNRAAGYLRRSRHLLAALEAGETVTVDSFRFPRGMVARDMFPDHDGHRYTVTSDDVVTPSVR